MKANKCVNEIERCGERVYRTKKARIAAKNINRVGKLIKYATKTYGGYPA